MLLIIYALLALVPLLGIVWVLSHGSFPPTVDDLFTSLIFGLMSAIFVLSALFELRRGKATTTKSSKIGSGVAHRAQAAGNSSQVEQGRVENVLFFESQTGEPNKSIVTLSDGPGASRWLVFEGDVRNALPVGKKVEITSRQDAGRKILLDVQYD